MLIAGALEQPPRSTTGRERPVDKQDISFGTHVSAEIVARELTSQKNALRFDRVKRAGFSHQGPAPKRPAPQAARVQAASDKASLDPLPIKLIRAVRNMRTVPEESAMN